MIAVNEKQAILEVPIEFPTIKFEHKYILYLIISRFYVFSSVWLIFLYSLGYSLQTVLMFNFLTLGITIILEIPAGLLAERIGHKKTLLLAYFTYFMSVSILLINYSLPFLVLSTSFWGIGNSLTTDTEDIWLYNQLMSENNFDRSKTELEFSSLYSKFIFLGFISAGIGEIIGSLSYNLSVTIPILLSAGMMLFTMYWVLVAPTIHVPLEGKQTTTNFNYKIQLKEFFSLSIFKLIFAFVVLNSTLISIIIWFPNYLVTLNMEIGFISIIIGCGTLITGLGIIFSSKFLTGRKGDKIIKVLIILIPFLLLNLIYQTNFLMIGSFLLIQAIYGSIIPYYRVKIIVNLPNDKKTLYLSIIGVISLIIYVLIDILTGMIILILQFTMYLQLVSLLVLFFIIPIILLTMKQQAKS